MKPHHAHGIICLAALRYCFGRRTSMPSLVTDYIKDQWGSFKDKDKALFKRDTEQALKDHFELDLSIGSEFNLTMYQNFLQWMKEQE